MSSAAPLQAKSNSAARVLLASAIGTTIEFFDFYIYATAAVLVFPRLFFPPGDQATAVLQSLVTFALAFFARPIGAVVFGHFGDRVGRKATLVAALLTMGSSTVGIGLIPSYASIGIAAPLLLALCRFGQGLGLGGEWGGAVLLATENAPPGKRALYGMFPQFGAPVGFLLSSSVFLALSKSLSNADFLAWGWRVPFIASLVLVLVGLYVRLAVEETPDFVEAMHKQQRVAFPMREVFARHSGALVIGSLGALTTFLLFYLMTVFTLSWGTSALGYARNQFLVAQMVGVLFFAAGIPLSAVIAGRIGYGSMLCLASFLIAVFGLVFPPFFHAGDIVSTTAVLAVGLFCMGLTYGPLGTALAAIFPTSVRYTGASLAFTVAGILGASLAPSVATGLATRFGLQAVGYYLAGAAVISLLALWPARARMQGE